MDNSEKLMDEIRKGINEILTPDTSKEMIDKLSSLSGTIDDASSLHNELKGDYEELKTDYLKAVKQAHFPSKYNPMEEEVKGPQTIDDITKEIFGL